MATSRRLGVLRLLCAVLAIGPLFPAVEAQIMNCYFFNGTIATNQLKCPDSDACCGRGSTCLSNRLCTDGADYGKKYVRGPCADKEWGPNCPQICKYRRAASVRPGDGANNLLPPNKRGFHEIHPAALNINHVFKHAQHNDPVNNNIRVQHHITLQHHGANPANPAATLPGTESASDNKPLMIGLGVGIALGVLLIAGMTFLAVRALRKRAYAKGAASALAGPQSEVAQLAGSEPGHLAPPNSYGGSKSSSSRSLVEMGSQTHSEMGTPLKGHWKGASGPAVEIGDPLHSELDTPPMRQASFYNPNAVELGGQMAVELETPFHSPPGWQQGDPYPRPQRS
ncbi:hypothetical protein N0V88_006817 [Collariella sp. IMI 366227]|nr:hypothetical protein N0V88_006817 [Collariella sp. IMI 366227]